MPSSVPSAGKPRMRTSIRGKALRHMVLLACAMILGLSLVSFLFMSQTLRGRVLTQAGAIAEENVRRVEDLVTSAKYRAAIMASSRPVRQAVNGSMNQAGWEAVFAELKTDRPDLQSLGLFGANGGRMFVAGSDMKSVERVARMVFRPVMSHDEWASYDVIAPVRDDLGVIRAYLVMRHDAGLLVRSMLPSLPSLGRTADMYMALEQNDRLFVIHPSENAGEGSIQMLGSASQWREEGLPLSLALQGREGEGETIDHAGSSVLAAYRPLPSLGWGMTVQVDAADALSSVRVLGFSLLAVGASMLLLVFVIGSVLARELTQPLLELSQKVSAMKPGAWSAERTVATGDEVEVLDAVVCDMSHRLDRMYTHLEEEVADRTKELKRQYAFDRAVLDGIQYGVVIADLSGTISGANPAAVTLLGWQREDFVGKKVAERVDLARMEKERALTLEPNPLAYCLSSGQSFRPKPGTSHGIRRADGAYLPVTFLVSPLVHDGKTFGAVLVFQDVRDERRMDHLKSEFITLASHQLRTPLSILNWHVDLLADQSGLDADGTSSLKEMRHATDRMTHLLDALLQVARLEDGALTPNWEDVDACEFLHAVSAEVKTMADKADIRFVFACPAEPVRIKTDRMLLGTALQNLVSNALKYSPKGAEVGLLLEKRGDRVAVIVRDNGMGIPAKDLRHLFEKFFRADNVKKIDTDGTGLGLYISKMIVDGLGGSIQVESDENKGTTFTVLLPIISR